jgi:hypothetical protein
MIELPPIEVSASVSDDAFNASMHAILATMPRGVMRVPVITGVAQGLCCCGPFTGGPFLCHHGTRIVDRCGKCIAERRADVAAHVERAVAQAHLSLAAAREFGFARLDLAAEEARVRNMFPTDEEPTLTDAELAAMVAEYESRQGVAS